MKEILRRLGIEELNYMQQDSLTANRKKDNVILISPTGSGKTLAYLLPLVQRVDKTQEEVQAVIVVPIFAPIITPIAWERVSRPALTNPTTITVVALED